MKKIYLAATLLCADIFADTTLTVSNSNPSGAGSLAQAISDINTASDTVYNVQFTVNPVSLTGSLPLLNLSGATPLTATVNFNPSGGGHVAGLTINGGGNESLFFVAGGTVTMNDMTVTGGFAKGGDGSAGGGGALGAGGAIFIANGATFQGADVHFTSNNATGGNGSMGNSGNRSGGGGGGMLQGNGGGTTNSLSGGGGGGIMANGDPSTIADGANGGGPDPGTGGGPGPPFGPLPPQFGQPGGYASGGGGAGSFVITPGNNGADGGAGGYGGGGGGGSVGDLAGNGGAGGNVGGGGGSAAGGGSFSTPPVADSGGNGGQGGFGGGGGGGGAGFGGGQGLGGPTGNAIYGGGAGGIGSTSPNESNGGGGGGSALGGAIFVDTGASFSLIDSANFSGNTLTAGAGGSAGGNDATAGANGSTFGSDIFLNSGTTANFTINSASNLAGSIAGFGSISKTGAATLTIGDISDANIQQITVDNGILSTPGSVNTLAMSFQLTPDPNTFGKLEVGGTANIGTSSLLLDLTPGTYSGEYEILTSGTMNGVFASVSPLPGVTFALDYRGNNVFIVFPTLPNVAINTEGLSGNALAIANYLNTLNASTYSSIINSLNILSFSDRKKALDAMSPSTNSFGPFVSQNMQLLYQESISLHEGNQRMLHHLGKRESEKEFVAANETPLAPYIADEEKPFAPIGKMRDEAKYNVWLSGIGQFAKQDALHQNPTFHASSGGFLLGFDYGNSKKGLVGCAVGYANSFINKKQNLGHIRINQYLTALYGSLYWDHAYFDVAIWNSVDTFENRRNIYFTGFHESAKSSHVDYQLSPHIGFGGDWFVGAFGFEPFCNVDWPINFESGFSEKGAELLNMKQKSQTDSMLRIEPGFRFYSRIFSSDWVFLLREKVSYIYKKNFSGGNHITANIVGEPGSFGVVWMTSAQSLFSGSIELFGKSKNNTYFSVAYDGEFGSGYISNQIMARVGWYF